MSTPVLHVEHITMQFGGVVAVNDLSMDIYPGEIVALIGPNGAGKTTAFNCITGVYEPTNGRVDFMGEPIVCNHPRGKMKRPTQASMQSAICPCPLSPTHPIKSRSAASHAPFRTSDCSNP